MHVRITPSWKTRLRCLKMHARTLGGVGLALSQPQPWHGKLAFHRSADARTSSAHRVMVTNPQPLPNTGDALECFCLVGLSSNALQVLQPSYLQLLQRVYQHKHQHITNILTRSNINNTDLFTPSVTRSATLPQDGRRQVGTLQANLVAQTPF